MTTGEIIATIVSAVIVGGAVAYIIYAKKKGKHCIGCPDRGSCQKKNCFACKAENKGEKE